MVGEREREGEREKETNRLFVQFSWDQSRPLTSSMFLKIKKLRKLFKRKEKDEQNKIK